MKSFILQAPNIENMAKINRISKGLPPESDDDPIEMIKSVVDVNPFDPILCMGHFTWVMFDVSMRTCLDLTKFQNFGANFVVQGYNFDQKSFQDLVFLNQFQNLPMSEQASNHKEKITKILYEEYIPAIKEATDVIDLESLTFFLPGTITRTVVISMSILQFINVVTHSVVNNTIEYYLVLASMYDALSAEHRHYLKKFITPVKNHLVYRMTQAIGIAKSDQEEKPQTEGGEEK